MYALYLSPGSTDDGNSGCEVSAAPSDEILDQARMLVAEGWHANLAHGAVTRQRDCKSGIVEDAVWEAMQLLQRERGWGPTTPQVMGPDGSW